MFENHATRHMGDDEPLNRSTKKKKIGGTLAPKIANILPSYFVLCLTLHIGRLFFFFFPKCVTLFSLAFKAVKSLFRLKFTVFYKGNLHHAFHLCYLRFISLCFFSCSHSHVLENVKENLLTWVQLTNKCIHNDCICKTKHTVGNRFVP